MSTTTTYTHCPICTSNTIEQALTVTDYTVSKEDFQIWGCTQCGFRFTQAVPDASSIGRYYQSDNYISHSDTSKGIINRLYHFIRGITLRQKRALIQRITGLPSGNLLDLGAGTGAFAAFMKQSGWQVTALEPDEAARSVAQSINNITLLPADTLFELPADSFHAITLWHVLEHVHTFDNYLIQLKKIVSPKGRLLIAVPNYTSYDADVYDCHWAAYDVPRHLYHFSPQAMRQLLHKHELTLVSIKPMWFDSFYVSMLSEKYKTGKTSLWKSLMIGFRSNWKALTNKERCSSVIYIIRK